MEHKLIQGGEQYLPFARSRIKALRATGLKYATQRFSVDGVDIAIRVVGEHEYIEIKGGEQGATICLGDISYPTTIELTTTIHTKGLKLRTGRTSFSPIGHPGPFALVPSSVSPFSTKNITAVGNKQPLQTAISVLINGQPVARLDNISGTSPAPEIYQAASFGDSAAVVVAVRKPSNDTHDQNLTAYIADYARDEAGSITYRSDGQPNLEPRTIPLTTPPGGVRPDGYVVVNKRKEIFTLALRATSTSGYIWSVLAYLGATPTEFSHSALTLPYDTSKGPPSIIFFAVGAKTCCIGYTTYVPGSYTVANEYADVFEIKRKPFSLLKLKTVSLGTRATTPGNRYEGMACAVSGYLWGKAVCLDLNSGQVLEIPDPINVPPSYISVATGGKQATFYWTHFSKENLALAGIPVNTDGNYARTSLKWPLDVTLGVPWDATFRTGVVITYRVITDDEGVKSVVEVPPEDISDSQVPNTRWDFVGAVPNYGSTIEFSKQSDLR